MGPPGGSGAQASKTARNEIKRKLILEERLKFDAILGEAIIFSVRSATYSMPDER
jgi:hypothetical protein